MSRLRVGAASALILIGGAAATAPGALAAGGPPPPTVTPLVSSPTTFTTKGCYEAIVPQRVSSLHIRAQGASGSPGYTDLDPNPAGRGAVVQAVWPVTPGQSLIVCVARFQALGGNLEGFGDGGGAASVGLAPWNNTGRPQLIAAGGGGGGSSAFGPGITPHNGQGGDAGWPGHPAGNGITDLPPGPGQGAGGLGATDSGPGAGGAKDPNTGSHVFDYVEDGVPGTSFAVLGEAGEGGQGANGMVNAPDVFRGGGGGGSGLYGGGGGGSSINGNGGPGGGGMSDCGLPATGCGYAQATGYGYGAVKLTWTVDADPVVTPDPTDTVDTTTAGPAKTITNVTPTAPATGAVPVATPAATTPAPAATPAARGAVLPTAAEARTAAVQKAWGVHLKAADASGASAPVVRASKAHDARLPLLCPKTATGCDASGTLQIDLPSELAKASATRALTTLATFRGVGIKAGQGRLLKVKLKASVIRRLQREGIRAVRATLTIDNHLDGGPTVRTTQHVVIRIPVLKAAKPKRKAAAVSPSFTG